jgi:hypothetical protein
MILFFEKHSPSDASHPDQAYTQQHHGGRLGDIQKTFTSFVSKSLNVDASP